MHISVGSDFPMNFRVLVLLILGAVVSNSAPGLKWSPTKFEIKFEAENYVNYDVDKEWTNFRNTYKRAFNLLGQEEVRKTIFEKNLRTIKLHNLRHSRGLSTFKMAVNEFADLTSEEYSKLMLGTTKMNKTSRSGSTFMKPLNMGQLPEEVDWRKHGYVTPVKNQGHCGSCWAFSSVGAIEGQHFRKTGKLVPLSEQNLVDCSFSFGNRGCNGGLMDQAFDYVENNSGVDTEASYPYVAHEQACHFNKETVGATVSGHVDVEPNEFKLQEALATVGPVSVAINAGVRTFRFYSEGVYDESECNPEELNHGVLAVGYGSENGMDYWLVKNSWGESWGIGGYVKMSRNKSNQCGIASAASYPLV